MTCAPRNRDTQPFPRTGLLASNTDIFLDTLYERITDNHATVYCYVIATVLNRSGQFAQTGSPMPYTSAVCIVAIGVRLDSGPSCLRHAS